MITAQYKGQKVQIVPAGKGLVIAKVGGVIVAAGCTTAQEAKSAAHKFIDELESEGSYSVTPAPTVVSETVVPECCEPEPCEDAKSTGEFLASSGKKGNNK